VTVIEQPFEHINCIGLDMALAIKPTHPSLDIGIWDIVHATIR
jgi:hypothetical protein